MSYQFRSDTQSPLHSKIAEFPMHPLLRPEEGPGRNCQKLRPLVHRGLLGLEAPPGRANAPTPGPPQGRVATEGHRQPHVVLQMGGHERASCQAAPAVRGGEPELAVLA